MTPEQLFEAQRRRLLGIAYRMLASRADAEDVVQDAWFKWARIDAATIANPQAFLTTMVSRLCLDRLRQEQLRRQAYVGPWLPEPIADWQSLCPASAREFADDLSYALLLALERLSPLERAAFILHDVFDEPFSAVAETLGRSEAAARQLAARARKSVRQARPQRAVSPDQHRKLLDAFLAAMAAGDAEGLKALLREDALYVSDSGGHSLTARRPIYGGERIVRLLTGVRRKFPMARGAVSTAIAAINGRPTALVQVDGQLRQMISIEVDGECIAAIFLVGNPEKLRWLEATTCPAAPRKRPASPACRHR